MIQFKNHVHISLVHSLYCLGGSGWEGGYLSLAGRIGETLEIFYFHHNTTGVWPIYHSQESKASSFRHRCLISNWSISCFAYLSLHITLGCKRLAVFSVIYHLSLEVLGSIFSPRPLGPLLTLSFTPLWSAQAEIHATSKQTCSLNC